MIDIKIGENPKNNQTTKADEQKPHNHNEDNILAQIRYVRDKQIEHNQIVEKQNFYRNIILIAILITSIIIMFKF